MTHNALGPEKFRFELRTEVQIYIAPFDSSILNFLFFNYFYTIYRTLIVVYRSEIYHMCEAVCNFPESALALDPERVIPTAGHSWLSLSLLSGD